MTAPTIDADLIAFANRLADASGAVIRPFFRKPHRCGAQGRACMPSILSPKRIAAPSAPCAT